MGARRQSKSKDQFGLGLHKQFAKPCISKPHGQLCHFWIATAEERKKKKILLKEIAKVLVKMYSGF